MPSPADILLNVFGHRQFRGTQREIIERLLGGGHCLVIMPTGMGKSVCYQIPAIFLADQHRSVPTGPSASPDPRIPLTLVISPLIALMKDQVDALVAKGVDATFVNSSLQRQQRLERYAGIVQRPI